MTTRLREIARPHVKPTAIPDAIAAGLREAIERRDELGVLGRERAKDFTWIRAAEAHVEVYRGGGS
jgi:hypothetical protein